jgi:glyoxylase-like metal-dependent hydrolase (beta-lactamase superfamily II)
MAAYMRSLNKLLYRDDALYWPTHGPSIPEPKPFVNAFIAHRRERSNEIMKALAAGDTTIPQMVARIYKGLDPKLTAAAGRSVLAHLVELVETKRVLADGPPALDGRYKPAR